jgi:hypothetical protein
VKTDAKWQGLKGFVSGNGLFFLRATVEDDKPGKVQWFSVCPVETSERKKHQ